MTTRDDLAAMVLTELARREAEITAQPPAAGVEDLGGLAGRRRPGIRPPILPDMVQRSRTEA